MKKLIALLAVCGFAFTFVACGGQKAEEAATEEAAPATEEVAPVEETDSTEVEADSTAAE